MLPLLKNFEDWGEMRPEAAQSGYVSDVERFVSLLNDALSAMKDNVQLAKPDRRFAVDSSAASIGRASASPDIVESYESTSDLDAL